MIFRDSSRLFGKNKTQVSLDEPGGYILGTLNFIKNTLEMIRAYT